MKHITFWLLFALSIQGVMAQKYFTKTGLTEFKASVAAFEPVEAKNNSTSAILNATNGQVASLLFVKAFRFRVALMEEHFNENYMDSDKYPKASFKGKVIGFDLQKLTNQTQTYTLQGTLTIRGKSKAVKTKAHIRKLGSKVVVISSFWVKPADFDIKIPSIVRKKIAKSIEIKTHYELIKR
ncbi:hypothetical protein BKI52_19910 [marine bacterium AO1-C]|nr:hypothetical protein BKI52_19910 [marine bacterium AO1-C]